MAAFRRKAELEILVSIRVEFLAPKPQCLMLAVKLASDPGASSLFPDGIDLFN